MINISYIINNNFILIPRDSDDYLYYKNKFQIRVKINTGIGSTYEYEKLYFEDSDYLYLPRGYIDYILPRSLQYEETSDLADTIDSQDIKIYTHMSDKVILRPDQEYMIKQIMTHKRGICQASTGSGKSEVMAGFMKTLYTNLGYYPPTLLLEPTLIMVNSIAHRFEKYDIPVYLYEDIRDSKEFPESGIVISHPMSIFNDIQSNSMDLSNVKILLGDECQHFSAITWRTLFYQMKNVEFSIGMSAKAVIGDFIDINRYDIQSATIIGATGNVIVDIDSSFYIEQGILSTPKVFKIDHLAVDQLKGKYNWHEVNKKRLQSPVRSEKVADLVSRINNYGYKSLILCNTKNHAKLIMKLLDYYDTSKDTLISFGGNEFLVYKDGEFIDCDHEDPMSLFEEGIYSVLIGTTHMYEGVDIPNLDIVVLASVGKSVRRVIQAVGRSIRKSKTGKYAYIIDFTDKGDNILQKHSRERSKVFREEIGVPKNSVYIGDVDYLDNIFKNLENLI